MEAEGYEIFVSTSSYRKYESVINVHYVGRSVSREGGEGYAKVV